MNLYTTNKMLTQWKADKPVLKEVHSQVLQNVQERVDLAFQAFFRRVKTHPEGTREPGYPRFKGKGRYDSFTFKQSGFKLVGDKLTISKVGNVRIKLHRDICASIKTLTIQRDAVGNFYACFACECDDNPLPTNHNVVGIDLGLTTFAYFSNGDKIDRQRWMKEDTKDIARLQRKKERFAKGSAARRKLVNAYQFIAFEKLDIKDMQGHGRVLPTRVNGNTTISRGIARPGGTRAWGQFVQFTTYKAENAGRGVAHVNPRGTTQMCSGCGSIVPKDLNVRIHDCPMCGLRLNRDHNAALNILARGLASVNADSSDEVVEAHSL